MKPILFLSFFFLSGCSTCNFVFDMWGNAKGHCFARENAVKLCKDHGGIKKDFAMNSTQIMCADGTYFKGYKNDWNKSEVFP